MAKHQERSIKINQDMAVILTDMVLDGVAATLEDALKVVFDEWLIQASIEMGRKQIGEIGVDSGTITIADPCYKRHIPDPIEITEGKTTDTVFCMNTPHGDGVFPVYKEEWDGTVRIVVEFPKLQSEVNEYGINPQYEAYLADQN